MAKSYFEDLRLGTSGEVKMMFSNIIMRCDWIINQIQNRLGRETLEIFKNEMKDSLAFDSIMDNLVHLNTDQRQLLEEIIVAMTKGETVKIIDEQKQEQVC